jgi:hypothetical protein
MDKFILRQCPFNKTFFRRDENYKMAAAILKANKRMSLFYKNHCMYCFICDIVKMYYNYTRKWVVNGSDV